MLKNIEKYFTLNT